MPKAPQVLAHIFTVSELNRKIKAILEQNFPFIWISGEISNFRIPSSGHFYFTLKDDTDTLPVKNLYKNITHYVDSLVGKVFTDLKQKKLLEKRAENLEQKMQDLRGEITRVRKASW